MKKYLAMKMIPKDTCYCYTSDYEIEKDMSFKIRHCPFWCRRKTDFGFSGKKEAFEYCRYLKKYLSVQDQVKDCGIGEVDYE